MCQTQRNIVWITSYPKSGNTWFRVFLSSYLNPERKSIDINSIDSTDIMVGNRTIVDQIIGTNTSDLSLEEVFFLRAEVYRTLSKKKKGHYYAKVHDAWQKNLEGKELFPSNITYGAILIVRNPFDIAASLSNHSGKSIKECISIINNPNYCFSYNKSKLSTQLNQFVGSWSDHFRSWVDSSGLKVHLIRYEDMMLNPIQTFSDAITFIGQKPDEDLIKVTINKCSFNALQNQEKNYGFNEKPSTSRMFFHTGKMNYGMEYLDDKDIKSIIDNHTTVLKRLRYI